MSAILLLTAVLVLAYWNGANDVSKGVATLAGSGVTRLRSAVLWGSIWTAAGGVAAAFAATGVALFDEILERGERTWRHATHGDRHERLQQASEKTALQLNLGVGQSRRIGVDD